MTKKSAKGANQILNKALIDAKLLFNAGKYKEAARLYSDIARNVYYWKKNVKGDNDDTGRQKREGDNKDSGTETES
jgi:hypothetical protein